MIKYGNVFDMRFIGRVLHNFTFHDNFARFSYVHGLSLDNIYIFIAFALYESVILNVLQFPMQNIYQSCDIGRVIGGSNVNTSQ